MPVLDSGIQHEGTWRSLEASLQPPSAGPVALTVGHQCLEQRNVQPVLRVCASCSVVSDSLRPRGLQPTGSSIHGILQARVLEWVAISFSGAQ